MPLTPLKNKATGKVHLNLVGVDINDVANEDYQFSPIAIFHAKSEEGEPVVFELNTETEGSKRLIANLNLLSAITRECTALLQEEVNLGAESEFSIVDYPRSLRYLGQ